MVFLAETWLDKARPVVIRDGLQFGGYHGVLKIYRGGDLALFWKNDMELYVESSSPNHIDARGCVEIYMVLWSSGNSS